MRSKKKILVTGSAGFIGFNLMNKLCQDPNLEVIGIDNFSTGFNRHPCTKNVDILLWNDHIVPLLKDVDTIYHLASYAVECQSIYNPVHTMRTNVLATTMLLENAIKCKVKNFVFASSVLVHGKPSHIPLKEYDRREPIDPYGISKRTIEDLLKVYDNDINTFITRFVNTYGPHQRLDDPYKGLIPIFINKVMKGESPVIYGSGNQTRAFTFIDDVVEPLTRVPLMDKLRGSSINIGGQYIRSVNQIFSIIAKALNSKVQAIHRPGREHEIDATYLDVEKMENLLGYSAKIPPEVGINRTIKWAKKQGPKEFKYAQEYELPNKVHEVYRRKEI